jgi:hypothetical protein
MPFQLKVRDQEGLRTRPGGAEFVVYLAGERVSVRELIRQRVLQEVAAYNERRGEVFQGLVQPTGAERTLNGYRMPKQRTLDATQQVEKALQAFEENGFILLVDERQAAGLDEWVELKPDSQVTFLKLVPLVGG